MSERFQEEFEDKHWQPGEVRTFTHVDHQRGVWYSGQWVMTVDGTIFGPCNETWLSLAAVQAAGVMPTRGRTSR